MNLSSAPSENLFVWSLTEPTNPVRVGEMRLTPDRRDVFFMYDASWIKDGYPLSGDMPLHRNVIVPKNRGLGLGAINDAMPDRWGERAIRFLDKPKRATPLDFLYYAGDRRFGSLGFSITPNGYEPHDKGPLPELDSIESLQNLLDRIENHQPLNAEEKLLASSSKTMGGAHPKALVQIEGREWIAKFPRGSNVDIGLIEHASMMLASSAGITVPETRVIRTLLGHVIAIDRFDRDKGKRIHALSAKTALLSGVDPTHPPLEELSYPAMADFIRQFSRKEIQSTDRRQLFRRMVFNILLENTDDHEKNHAFLSDGQAWSLAPAYDVLPSMSNSGIQQMMVGNSSADGTLSNALSQCHRFDLDRTSAITEWYRVADRVSQWKEVFSQLGVTSSDIDYLSDFIDSEDRLMMRNRHS